MQKKKSARQFNVKVKHYPVKPDLFNSTKLANSSLPSFPDNYIFLKPAGMSQFNILVALNLTKQPDKIPNAECKIKHP